MARENPSERTKLLAKLEDYLRRKGIPRVQAFVMVTATGLIGFLASAGLLKVGLKTMWIRYGLAVLAAYGAFLFFVWLWVIFYRGRLSPDSELTGETDLMDEESNSQGPAASLVRDGKSEKGTTDWSSSTSFDIPFDLDFDEFIVVVAVIAGVAAALFSSLYVIFTAPALFAEVLLDGVLSAALYTRLRRVEQQYWLQSAIIRTRFPILATLVLLMVLGLVFQWFAPSAVSIGGVWKEFISN
jgi:hypothetical protein